MSSLNVRMRPNVASTVNHALVLAALCVCVVTGATVGIAAAHADPVGDYVAANGQAVCQTLDKYPSVEGIEGIGLAIMDEGITPFDAGQIIARSVGAFCPQHVPEVQAFIAKYSTPGQTA